MRAWAAAVSSLLVGLARIAAGQENPPDQSAAAPAQASASPHEGDLWTRDALTGNWGGERSKLEDEGILLGADTIDEVLGNPSGGIRRGAIYEGRLELLATIDLDKTIGWTGATAHANAYWIRGRGLSANNLENLATVSNIEADRSFRLFDLWVEQSLFQTTLSIRAGQIAADDEFVTSDTASTFINGTFGWPAILSTDLPNGGAAYPLATPGIRVKYAATDALSASLGVFNGDPAGSGPGDPQARDGSGTAFRLGGTAFLITEFAYAVNQDPNASGLAQSYELGAWFHSGPFNDQRFSTDGLSLASPASSGIPQTHQNDAGLYLIADRALLHDGTRNLSVFARFAAAPDDRNEVSLYADGGIAVAGYIPGRNADVIGVAGAIARISNRARELDADAQYFTGLGTPIRNSEAVVELTYRAQVTPWWTVQPDFQFIRHPGANTRAIPNATVLGLRFAIVF